MQRFQTFIISAALALVVAVLFAAPAAADAVITGPVCVIDGNTLQVGEKVKDGKCWGGIPVRLYGSNAPGANETCTTSAGKAWNCGQRAKAQLLKLIRNNSVSCYHLDGAFVGTIPIGTCISGRSDLALEMVRSGMAKALHDHSNRYILEENDAKAKKRGLWK